MIYLQSDWTDAFRRGEPAWVSLKLNNGSEHGQLPPPVGGSSTAEWSGSGGFRARRLPGEPSSLEVTHPSSPDRHRFLAAADSLCVHTGAVTCLDVTRHGGLGLSCSADDTLRIWELETGAVRRELEGHLGQVYTCRWLPSGLVALSGGADMQLKLWSAETGQCHATLRGHTGAVQHTAILDRGRNIVSVGRDGRCKLWDVGQQSCLEDLVTGDSVLHCVTTMQTPPGLDPGLRQQPPNEREVGTEGRLLAVGAEDGSLQLLHVHTRQLAASWQLGAPVLAVTPCGPEQLAAGCGDGAVHWLDLRSGGSPLATIRRSASAVLALAACGGRLMAARADGTVHSEAMAARADGTVHSEAMESVLSLSGPDCDAVYGLAGHGSRLFTASKQGMVRSYRLPPAQQA